jgi:hypothetical protein
VHWEGYELMVELEEEVHKLNNELDIEAFGID